MILENHSSSTHMFTTLWCDVFFSSAVFSTPLSFEQATLFVSYVTAWWKKLECMSYVLVQLILSTFSKKYTDI